MNMKKVLTITLCHALYSSTVSQRRVKSMAKQTVTVRKLILNAGKATLAYPVGPILGAYGINLGVFIKEYNTQTAALIGYQVPVEVTIYTDRSFTMRILEPTVASLLWHAAGIEKG